MADWQPIADAFLDGVDLGLFCVVLALACLGVVALIRRLLSQ